MKNLEMIKTEMLEHHPQNPRKDIGDVTELADSIKAKGVLQNLTVVPNAEGEYYVVIGNRRLEAAKLAGVEELPCVVAEMTEKEQIETMLLENIQREDLTIKEQADGFQLMMDLGSTVNEMSERTGFSKSTIYHRLNIAKLDKDVVEQKTPQMTMQQLAALEQIKDISRRNDVLMRWGGNSNFAEYAKQEARRERTDERMEKLQQAVEKSGIPKTKANYYSWSYDIEILQEFNCGADTFEMPEEFAPGEFFFANDYGCLYIAKKKEKTVPEESPEEQERVRKIEETRNKQNQRRKIRESIAEKVKNLLRAHAWDEDCDIELSEADTRTLAINYLSKSDCLDDAEFLAQAENPPIQRAEEESEWEYRYRLEEEAERILEKKSLGTIFLAVIFGGDLLALENYQGYTGTDLPIIEIAKKIGLVLSEEEEALVNGTSELYV